MTTRTGLQHQLSESTSDESVSSLQKLFNLLVPKVSLLFKKGKTPNWRKIETKKKKKMNLMKRSLIPGVEQD